MICMPRLITTYIFKEMTGPFLLTAVVLSVTILLGKVLKLVELFLTQGVGIKYIFLFVASMLPSFLIYTLPASFLVAVLIACTRLSSDNEVIALKSSGISLAAVIKPVFLLATIVYVVTLLTNLYLYPWGNQNFKRLLFEVATTRATAGIDEKTFYDQFQDVIVYVDHIPPQRGELEGVFISKQTEDGQSEIVVAKRGVFVSSPEDLSVVLKLEDGTIHRKSPSEETYHMVNFSGYNLELGLRKGFAGKKSRSKGQRELYVRELIERVKEFERTGGPADSLRIDLHKRFALPAVVFVFALIGVPLGMQKVRAARSTGFGLATGVLLIYYILSKSIETMGDNGVLNPVVAAWGSDIILAALGLYILSRAAREKDMAVAAAIERTLSAVCARIGILARSRK